MENKKDDDRDALRASEERLRLFVAASSDMTYRMSADWRRMYALDGRGLLASTTGARLTWLSEYIPTSDKQKVRAAVKEAVRTKKNFELEHRVVRADGSIGWVFSRAVPLLNDTGEVLEWFGAASDITARKQAETTLEETLASVVLTNEELEEHVQKRTQELKTMADMRQDLLRRLVKTQEDERARLARDLHDDTGQQVTGLLLGLSALKNHPAVADDPAIQSALADLQGLANDIAQKSHRIAVNLRPTALDDIGLMQALTNYAEQWNGWSGLSLHLHSNGMEDADGRAARLAADVETTIYRVVQEALTNILRHVVGKAGCDPTCTVSVLVQKSKRAVLTIIEDDGPGFDVEAALNVPPSERRLGLFGMQERAALVGGSLEVESTPGEGTTVYLRIPLP